MALNTTFVAGTTVITAAHLNGIQSAWASWTPTLSAGAGTFTTVATTTAKYQQIGKSIWYYATFTITAFGTASGNFKFTLPTTPIAGTVYIGSGRESAATGVSLMVNSAGGNVADVNRYDNSSIIASGRTINVSGFYESA